MRGPHWASVLACLALITLSACTRSTPAPVEQRGLTRAEPARLTTVTPRSNAPSQARQTPKTKSEFVIKTAPQQQETAPKSDVKKTMAASRVCDTKTVFVQAGDTLYAISRRCDVPLRALIDANALVPPYTLSTGQTLIIPAVRTHTVQSGETLYSISRQYGVDLAQMVRQNALQEPLVIKVGQVLVLPSANSLPENPVSPTPVVTNAQDALPKPPPARLNTSAPVEIEPPNGFAALPQPRANQVSQANVPVKPVAPPPQDGAELSFAWPLKGRVVSSFGPKAGGQHNDGINILAPENAAVRAAESGTVAYAGNGLKGFGNLLLLRHKDGYVTAYAHNAKLLVKRGESVKKGQIIARVGRTGNVEQAQLHFEVRRGSRALDPKKILEG